MRADMAENFSATKPFCIFRETPGEEAAQATASRLAEEVAAQHGPRAERSFALAARDAAGGWIGGVNGAIHWRWLYVSQFFIVPERRGLGLGRALLREAETLAQENDCVGLYLDTFSPEAVVFYKKCGFQIAGKIENFPPGAERIFLRKALAG
jgi:GNAT superfamily N-acetyltransferase